MSVQAANDRRGQGFRLAVFDYDGTLADSFPWFLDALDEAGGRFGFTPLPRDQVEVARGLGIDGLLRRLGVPIWKVPAIAMCLRDLAARDRGKIALFPGAAELLRDLAARGTVLAILTSNAEANVRATLGPELAGLFAHWQCDVSLMGKSAQLRKLLTASGAAPSEALMIGDEIRDLDAARSAKIAFGAVGWGFTAPHALAAAQPDLMFATLDEIAGHFNGR